MHNALGGEFLSRADVTTQRSALAALGGALLPTALGGAGLPAADGCRLHPKQPAYGCRLHTTAGDGCRLHPH